MGKRNMMTPRLRRRKSQCILAPSPQQGPRNQVITLVNIHTYTRLITHPNQTPRTLPTEPHRQSTEKSQRKIGTRQPIINSAHENLYTPKPSPDQVPAESGTQHLSTPQSNCWSRCPIQTYEGCPIIVAFDRCIPVVGHDVPS
jgi:hypothetical protein